MRTTIRAVAGAMLLVFLAACSSPSQETYRDPRGVVDAALDSATRTNLDRDKFVVSASDAEIAPFAAALDGADAVNLVRKTRRAAVIHQGAVDYFGPFSPAAFERAVTTAMTAKDLKVTYDGNVTPAASSTPWMRLFTGWIFLGGAIGLVMLFLARRRNSEAVPLSVGGARRFTSSPSGPTPEPPTERFGDVSGIDEIVDEVSDVVAYLRDPSRFSVVGARPPRGVLLSGPPGCGKTLLARAVAGEAGVPFFATSGSDFVEMFVGVGASRIRNLFKQARAAGSAVIFIDEIDAIGKARSSMPQAAGNDERESTLNALLVELDGFAKSSDPAAGTIFVLAATNRPELLDKALLRPGRFDRQLVVSLPDRPGREQILRTHSAKLPLAPDIDLVALSARTGGFSGADLENLVNTAALQAARSAQPMVDMACFDEAFSVVLLGPARRSSERHEDDIRVVAFHEAGHAIVGLLDPHAQDPQTVSVAARARAGGVTLFSQGDREMFSRDAAMAQLRVAMGGRAAETLFLSGGFTAGAANDLRVAADLADKMVSEWGMSSLGASGTLMSPYQTIPDSARLEARNELLEQALEDARALLEHERDLLDAVAAALIESETIDAERLGAIAMAHQRSFPVLH